MNGRDQIEAAILDAIDEAAAWLIAGLTPRHAANIAVRAGAPLIVAAARAAGREDAARDIEDIPITNDFDTNWIRKAAHAARGRKDG